MPSCSCCNAGHFPLIFTKQPISWWLAFFLRDLWFLLQSSWLLACTPWTWLSLVDVQVLHKRDQCPLMTCDSHFIQEMHITQVRLGCGVFVVVFMVLCVVVCCNHEVVIDCRMDGLLQDVLLLLPCLLRIGWNQHTLWILLQQCECDCWTYSCIPLHHCFVLSPLFVCGFPCVQACNA